jgi:predicted secreted hydrolase
VSTKRLHFGLLSLIVVLAIAACVKTAEPREIPSGASPDPTATPAPITLPQDELAHDSRLEWWYHSGHLESESGRQFGFHFVLFKADDGFGEPNYVAQLGILDVETGEHYDLSRAEAGTRQVGGGAMTLGIADWVYGLLPIDGSHSFAADNGDIGLSLDMEATTPVMLHNEIGWLPTEAGATYYYSWPRQEAVGQLTIDGETINVSGTSWFDHQWGDFFVLGKPAGWQWFALQFDDGGSLMITEARGIDGKIADTYGTYMSSEGEVRALTQVEDGIELATIGEWTSPTTGATYPSGWSLAIESLSMDLIITPEVNDQEVRGGLPAASTYWEGESWVGGRQNGEPIAGNAYVELSGFVDPEPIEWMRRR